MITPIDYALMAGRAYQTNRNPINQFAVAEGWEEFAHVPNNPNYPQFTGVSASVGRISLRNPPDEKMLNILKSFKHLPTDNAALIRPTESHA